MTSIEWTEKTWNPVRGCTKISPGCKNCYAETFAERWRGIPGHAYEQGFDLRLVPEALDVPLRRRKPTMYFVNSMSDLFHEDVPLDFIAAVFGVMAACPQHTFQVLTKRPERAREFFLWLDEQDGTPGWACYHKAIEIGVDPGQACGASTWRDHVWLGVSVEDQRRAMERVPALLQIPAAVRFLSCEPLLGPVELGTSLLEGGVRWVIVGGESGGGARECATTWVRDLVEECQRWGVPVFVKQLGAKPTQPLQSRKGNDPSEWPEDLRVREMPA